MKNKLLILCLLAASNHTIWSGSRKCSAAAGDISIEDQATLNEILPVYCEKHKQNIDGARIHNIAGQRIATFKHEDGTDCDSMATVAAIAAKKNKK